MTSKSSPISPRDRAAIFVILLVLLVGGVYATFVSVGHDKGSGAAADAPMIWADLPADAGEANAAFRARVLSGFPLQTPEDDMVQALSQQGFKSDGWFSKRMTFRRQLGHQRGCDFTASVTWESDDHARIRALDTRFLRTPGCADSL
jgi:hypothetical protein